MGVRDGRRVVIILFTVVVFCVTAVLDILAGIGQDSSGGMYTVLYIY